MKRFLAMSVLVLALAAPALAASGSFSPTVIVLEKEEIAKLSDEKLMSVYVDTLVDIEAIRTFHVTSGFSNAKQFNEYRGLLRFRLLLLMEIHNRSLEIPSQLEVIR